MSKATAKAELLSLLQNSAGKSKEDAQSDYANDLIDLISTLIESGTASTTVTGTLPSGSGPASGTGSTTIPP